MSWRISPGRGLKVAKGEEKEREREREREKEKHRGSSYIACYKEAGWSGLAYNCFVVRWQLVIARASVYTELLLLAQQW